MGTLLALEEQLDPAQAALDLADPGDRRRSSRAARAWARPSVSRWATAKTRPSPLMAASIARKRPRSPDRDRHGQSGKITVPRTGGRGVSGVPPCGRSCRADEDGRDSAGISSPDPGIEGNFTSNSGTH